MMTPTAAVQVKTWNQGDSSRTSPLATVASGSRLYSSPKRGRTITGASGSTTPTWVVRDSWEVCGSAATDAASGTVKGSSSDVVRSGRAGGAFATSGTVKGSSRDVLRSGGAGAGSGGAGGASERATSAWIRSAEGVVVAALSGLMSVVFASGAESNTPTPV